MRRMKVYDIVCNSHE